MAIPAAISPLASGRRRQWFFRPDSASLASLGLGLVPGAVVVFLVLGPLAMLLFSSFRATGNRLPFEATSFTLANYRTVVTSALTYKLLLNTVWYAAGSLALGMILALTFSWLLERTDIPGRRIMLAFIISSVAVPGLVGSMAWVMLANGTNGLLNVAIRGITGPREQGPLEIYSIWGMVFVTGISIVAPMYLMVSGTFGRMDPALEEAGRMSGASWPATLRRITLPLLKPGLLAAAIYYFLVVSELFEVPALLGMRHGIFMFSTTIYLAAHPISGLPDYGLASGYAMVSMAVALAFIWLYGRTLRGAPRYVVVTGKGYRTQPIRLGRFRYPAFAALILYFLCTVVLPFFALLWTSLLPFYALPSVAAVQRLSMANYSHLFSLPSLVPALQNTFIVMVATAFGTTVLASLVAWSSVRSIYRGSQAVERLTFLVAAIPAVVVGLALSFLYVSLPLPIYGTAVIIAIALVTRFMPFSTRVMSAALLQLHKDLEEAAQVSGANAFSSLTRVVAPLLWPSFSRAWLWVSMHAMRDSTLSLMLFVTSNGTVGALLWLIWTQYGDIGMAAALAVPLVLGSALLTFVLARSSVPSDQSSISSAPATNTSRTLVEPVSQL